jgi:hypothetical protein
MAWSNRLKNQLVTSRIQTRRASSAMNSIGADFSIVLRPDIAQRGSGFKVIRTAAEAEAYFQAPDVSVIAQRYFPPL